MDKASCVTERWIEAWEIRQFYLPSKNRMEGEAKVDFIENSVSRIHAWNSNGGAREGSEIYIELPVIRWKGKYVRFSRGRKSHRQTVFQGG